MNVGLKMSGGKKRGKGEDRDKEKEEDRCTQSTCKRKSPD